MYLIKNQSSISKPILIAFLCLISSFSFGQDEKIEYFEIDGHIVKAIITETDTILIADLDEMTVTSRDFENKAYERHYLNMRLNALKVYPYAVDAIKTYRELEVVTSEMRGAKRKKHAKKLQRRMEEEFKEPLKKLTRTQGKILIKMIERELQVPFYEVIKELRGGTSAFYWQRMAALYDVDLKGGYNPSDDEILEYVLGDLNISYIVPKAIKPIKK